jgi:hypothetical protein
MTDKKDAVLYSLSELEDMPQGEVAAPAETDSSGANIKRSRSKDKSWASDDDASDLLAGILDETSRSAEQEELERSRSLMALSRDKSDAAGSDKKREEGERRMAAEQARREEADRKRRVLLREIEGPSPEEIEAERRAAEEARQQAEMEEKLKEAERARMEAERRAAHAARESREAEQQRLEALAAGPSPSTAKTAGIGLMAVALAFFVVVVLIGGGVGAWFAFKPQETPVQTYRRAALVPTSVTSTSIEKGFVALVPPDTADDLAGASNGKARANKRGNRRAGKKGKKSAAGKKGRKFNFGASKGKIVF